MPLDKCNIEIQPTKQYPTDICFPCGFSKSNIYVKSIQISCTHYFSFRYYVLFSLFHFSNSNKTTSLCKFFHSFLFVKNKIEIGRFWFLSAVLVGLSEWDFVWPHTKILLNPHSWRQSVHLQHQEYSPHTPEYSIQRICSNYILDQNKF